ncbi:hypothetical protein PsorP6_001970 [Peronosclerospora sorghi]|uniref:Uncharacterized protein n=1 Tax=Peronosclerospora sorghi TaxID=230839 RepID=A0ACC0WS34_9STRA|nr:hypothetical protein PsorP6_001970 [Peronosclerospora sorghi]
MATSPTKSRRTRHIEQRWHFVREQVMRGVLQLIKVRGEADPADSFTKPLDKYKLSKFTSDFGVGHDLVLFETAASRSAFVNQFCGSLPAIRSGGLATCQRRWAGDASGLWVIAK